MHVDGEAASKPGNANPWREMGQGVRTKESNSLSCEPESSLHSGLKALQRLRGDTVDAVRRKEIPPESGKPARSSEPFID
jgi:hypothetical protein